MPPVIRRFADLAGQVLAGSGPVHLVGVDGCGGAGKTTFAQRLAHAAGGCPVVHTDDFSSWEQATEGWPRMLREVIEPLSRNESATFHPYDWVERRPAGETVTVEPERLVVVEGVGAIRAAWRDLLAIRIWVDTPRDLRLARGLERDGADLREFWDWWMVAEDAYVDRERPVEHADLVVDGAPQATAGRVAAFDPATEFVEIALSAPR